MLIDRRWNLSILDVRSFKGADCDTDDCLVVAKFRERLAVCKKAEQKFDVKRFNPRKLNELQLRKQYTITTLVVIRFSNSVVICEKCICTGQSL
jgi:hypothetical protein